MLRFVLNKMINKKWMVLALLIGNILLVSITGANVMYGNAVLQRSLTQDMAAYLEKNNRSPGLITIEATNYSSRDKTMKAAEIARSIPNRFGVEAEEIVEYYFLSPSYAKLDFERRGGMTKQVSLGYMKDIEDHIEIVAGRMYADEMDADGFTEVIVSEKGIASMKLTMNETFTMQKITDKAGNPIRIKVVGVFRISEEEDLYWVKSPNTMQRECFMSGKIFTEQFFGEDNDAPLNAVYNVLLDYTQMRGDRVGRYMDLSAEYTEYFSRTNGQSYREYFMTILRDFEAVNTKVNVTLWVLQVPIFTLLGAFIFMVSRQMLDMEQNEIAVLKSRGASRLQIITTYLLQSIVLAILGYAVGIPLGAYLVQVLGSANAFLEFVKRTALPIELSGNVLLFCAAAALFSVLAMVLPVLKHSTVTIVNHKQKKHRRSDAPLWQRVFLDVIVLALSLYLLYNYSDQAAEMAQRVASGASPDPLLFISSSLFMIGAGLFALRILPMITFLLYQLFKKQWSPSLYAAFLQVIRTRYSQSFIMVFLIITIALGVFNAQAARTINSSEEEDIRYNIGADIVVKENWKEAMDAGGNKVRIEPDYIKYEKLEEAESITKVFRETDCNVLASRESIHHVQLMAIHTKSFGETAWYKDEMFKSHFYDYLNALAANPRAVLVSRNFETKHGLRLGDTINYNNGKGDSSRGVIYGFIDYWPSFVTMSYSTGMEGTLMAEENYLVVANLNQVQAEWGVQPYEIWIKAKGSSQFMYDFAEEKEIYFTKFEDAAADVVTMKNNPIFQGTNGILTVGFIVVLMLCMVGFLIYWILSIRSRSLQFGIYRAMGMSMREVIMMLVVEQVFISGASIATGAFVGWLTSKLYIPLIQIAYAAYDNSLPLQIISEQSDMVRLFAVVGIMILVCMGILGWLISKMKIAQALKLGED